VLETACGTGIVTRELRCRLPPTTALVATDLNQPMIDAARAALGDPPGIEWRQADCTALPFEDGSFGAVVCQFGMMFVPDKGAAVREARRLLAGGGLLAFNVWDDLASNPFSRAVNEVVAGVFPSDPPRFFEVPYGSNDPAAWSRLLAEHGFVDPALDWVDFEARSPTAAQLALGLVRGTPVSNQIAERGGDFDAIVEAATAALTELGGAAPFRSPMRALVVTARAPAPGG
jgi:SAM-dependent methyltransferase